MCATKAVRPGAVRWPRFKSGDGRAVVCLNVHFIPSGMNRRQLHKVVILAVRPGPPEVRRVGRTGQTAVRGTLFRRFSLGVLRWCSRGEPEGGVEALLVTGRNDCQVAVN